GSWRSSCRSLVKLRHLNFRPIRGNAPQDLIAISVGEVGTHVYGKRDLIRQRVAGQVRVPAGIHGDAVDPFIADPADVAGIGETGPVHLNLRDPGVSSTVVAQVGTEGDREARVVRVRLAGNVGVP